MYQLFRCWALWRVRVLVILLQNHRSRHSDLDHSIITCGDADGSLRGSKYWENPGAFSINPELDVSLATGRFIALWWSVLMATFAYLGSELVGVTFAEAQNPRPTIPRAMKINFFRIVFLYRFSVLLLRMCIPYNSPDLKFANDSKATGA